MRELEIVNKSVKRMYLESACWFNATVNQA